VTLVADFNIVTIDGTQLCTLTQVEVERHESSPRLPVSHRHDLTFQPFAAPAITVEDHDIDKSPHEDMRKLYTYLDNLAAEAIINTLKHKPAAGTSVSLCVNQSEGYLPCSRSTDKDILTFRLRWRHHLFLQNHLMNRLSARSITNGQIL
jgi:hypothetical protein